MGGTSEGPTPQTRCPAQVLSDPHCGSPAADFAFFRRSPSCLVSCGEDGTVQLWDLRAGDAPQRKFRPACYGDGALPASVAVSGDDRRCAYSCGSRVHLLDLGEGEELFAHEDLGVWRGRGAQPSEVERPSAEQSCPVRLKTAESGPMLGRCWPNLVEPWRTRPNLGLEHGVQLYFRVET